MNIYEIIEKKKAGHELTKEEIQYFVSGYTKNEIPDYQISALLMAIFFQGLSIEETYYLTDTMLHSGETIDLSEIEGIKVDKHSTGGVGDTTTLVLAPLVASVGVPFAKMSGRGLGHTGGTLDKMESIPGMRIDLSIEEFIRNTNQIKMAVSGQTKDVAPADKKLYALRDATATVDNVSLISASILSKKIAVGSDALILDVKVGSGAFMKDIEAAQRLSHMMVQLGKKFQRKTVALITNMDEPLGFAVGNALEVIEAIDTLQGRGPKDLQELCLVLGAKLLCLSNRVKTEKEGYDLLLSKIKSGEAFEKFKEFVSLQGGDVSYVENTSKFSLSPICEKVIANKSGYVCRIDALEIGECAKNLGAGRQKKEDDIDLGAGILLCKKINDYVEKGDTLAKFYTNKRDEIERAHRDIENAFSFSDEKVEYQLIIEEIDD